MMGSWAIDTKCLFSWPGDFSESSSFSCDELSDCGIMGGLTAPPPSELTCLRRQGFETDARRRGVGKALCDATGDITGKVANPDLDCAEFDPAAVAAAAAAASWCSWGGDDVDGERFLPNEKCSNPF